MMSASAVSRNDASGDATPEQLQAAQLLDAAASVYACAVAMDSDGDGHVTGKEFVDFVGSKMVLLHDAQGGAMPSSAQRGAPNALNADAVGFVRAVMVKEMDSDGDGRLTAGEVLEYAARSSCQDSRDAPLTEQQQAEIVGAVAGEMIGAVLVQEMDSNGDGCVSMKEALEYMGNKLNLKKHVKKLDKLDRFFKKLVRAAEDPAIERVITAAVVADAVFSEDARDVALPELLQGAPSALASLSAGVAGSVVLHRQMDSDGDGRVSLEEAVDFVANRISSGSQVDARDAPAALKPRSGSQVLAEAADQVLGAVMVQEMDGDGDGRVSVAEAADYLADKLNLKQKAAKQLAKLDRMFKKVVRAAEHPVTGEVLEAAMAADAVCNQVARSAALLEQQSEPADLLEAVAGAAAQEVARAMDQDGDGEVSLEEAVDAVAGGGSGKKAAKKLDKLDRVIGKLARAAGNVKRFANLFNDGSNPNMTCADATAKCTDQGPIDRQQATPSIPTN
ncbi:hypothetical protein HXX76_001646 [Chlamydomonas incerta]|uniref:EF-hand domain-containing protein n=1 Tax=Chlamydomonas incerta TaxID=51695 RepID=A0A835WCJ2_CHLIN|nr:hypothetical protein HXX76_001646 [Chlamydomonas incerta]|eukprot:KAG2444910.1 hypothetical protein HXX76_001646 [Chlamydomonas incerta]